MRLLHTSDWHLGQHFFSKTRAAEHQAFFEWLLTQVIEHQVDVILVAGDVFDTGTPPSYARELYNSFVVSLQQQQCELVILAGNHDSVAMLNESKALLSCLNTRVITQADPQSHEQLLVLNDRQGNPAGLLCAIPFLRPRDLLTSTRDTSGDEKQLALHEAITAHYQQLYQAACAQREAMGIHLPIIATGHLTTVGSLRSESVRDIYIGTLDAYPAQAFPPADYIALGHIHRAQKVAGSEHIRYSGSPIPLSFDEYKQEKQVLLVDIDTTGLHQVTPLPVPCFQSLCVIRGDLAAIKQQLQALPLPEHNRTLWLAIEVSAHDYLSDIQQQINQLTNGLPVEVLLLRRATTHTPRLQLQQSETLHDLTLQEVFERRLAQETLDDETRLQRIRTLFQQVIHDIEHPESAE